MSDTLVKIAAATGAGLLVAYAASQYALQSETDPENHEEQETKSVLDVCKKARWQTKMCLSPSSYIGYSIPDGKQPEVRRVDAERVSKDLNAGPFTVTKVIKTPSDDGVRQGIFVMEAANGFIVVRDATPTSNELILEQEPTPWDRERLIRTLDDVYTSKSWLQAIRRCDIVNRFRNRFPTRMITHFDMDGWGITLVIETQGVRLFAYAIWDDRTA